MPLNGEALLKVEDLAKAFGHVQAVDGVSFEVHSGEVVALLGDNGAGKSTIVKMLAGVLRPDSGSISLSGREVELRRAIDARQHGIATVYQDLAVVDNLDVARNIFLGAAPRRWRVAIDYPRMYREAAGVLQTLRADLPSVRAKVGELSGGQRQAVAIARALAQEARIFVLDEPAAALGVAQQAKVNELIEDLHRDGNGILLISHNLEHVFQVAQRVIVLRHGRCVGVRQRADTTREEIVGLITGAVEGDFQSQSSEMT